MYYKHTIIIGLSLVHILYYCYNSFLLLCLKPFTDVFLVKFIRIILNLVNLSRVLQIKMQNSI